MLAGDATKRATEAAIAYDDAGAHELKGKAEPVQLWRALRVVAAAARRGPRDGPRGAVRRPRRASCGWSRSSSTRAPTSGARASSRSSASRGSASRDSSWEFEKYIDGLAADVWWHRGRCLSTATASPTGRWPRWCAGARRSSRTRTPEAAIAKLRATLELHVPDGEEREWIEPRLMHLLGLAERSAPDREDLFSAWRRFFERLAEQGPLVLVFEDIHWADEGLVAFVEYLLDWGRHHPIFVLTLARPEVADRHPGFPGVDPERDDAAARAARRRGDGRAAHRARARAARRRSASRLREAADGIPLFAVETVRMLRDRGLLEQVGDDVVVTGDLTALEVPETLHALIASRLDGVPEAERRLLQDASVLGKSFTRRGLAALSGLDEPEVERLADSLIRRELLTIDTDPFSPERGQLGFLQALVQRVTYETIGPARPSRAPPCGRRASSPTTRASTRTRSPR